GVHAASGKKQQTIQNAALCGVFFYFTTRINPASQFIHKINLK
ncbi:hypothetical protein ECP02989428_0734, partial [Escherichia coli P0298942.8]